MKILYQITVLLSAEFVLGIPGGPRYGSVRPNAIGSVKVRLKDFFFGAKKQPIGLKSGKQVTEETPSAKEQQLPLDVKNRPYEHRKASVNEEPPYAHILYRSGDEDDAWDSPRKRKFIAILHKLRSEAEASRLANAENGISQIELYTKVLSLTRPHAIAAREAAQVVENKNKEKAIAVEVSVQPKAPESALTRPKKSSFNSKLKPELEPESEPDLLHPIPMIRQVERGPVIVKFGGAESREDKYDYASAEWQIYISENFEPRGNIQQNRLERDMEREAAKALHLPYSDYMRTLIEKEGMSKNKRSTPMTSALQNSQSSDQANKASVTLGTPKNRRGFQAHWEAYQGAQKKASAIIAPILSEMVSYGNSSVLYGAIISIHTELTGAALQTTGPFAGGMSCIRDLEDRKLGSKTRAATLAAAAAAVAAQRERSSRLTDREIGLIEYYAANEYVVNLYIDGYRAAYAALEKAGLVEEMAWLEGRLASVNKALYPEGWDTEIPEEVRMFASS